MSVHEEQEPRFEKLREALAKADLPGASPLALALHLAEALEQLRQAKQGRAA